MIEASVPLSRLEHFARNGNPHLRPIYAAMRASGIGFALVQQRSGRFPPPRRKGAFVAIVGDDTDRSLGPAGFHRKSIRRLAAVTPIITVMSCELVPSVYAAAAAAASVMATSSLIVETRAEHEAEWLDLMQAAAPTAHLVLCTCVAGSA